jgi:hypothetical protein
MKKFTVIAAFALTVVFAYAVTLRLPDIPAPRLTAGEAIKITEDHIREQSKGRGLLLVGIDWCRQDRFTPRISDGTSYGWVDATEDWSWFLTYVGREAGSKTARYSEVHVFRVRDNGQISGPHKIVRT